MAELPSPAQIRDTMPFAALVGVDLLAAGPELVRGRVAWSPELCTAGGVMHGGAIMALADTCGGVCAFLNLPDGAQGTATIESKTNSLRAVREGRITATTQPLHGTHADRPRDRDRQRRRRSGGQGHAEPGLPLPAPVTRAPLGSLRAQAGA
jgi:uncharacterized protein (TIGR00369 family)